MTVAMLAVPRPCLVAAFDLRDQLARALGSRDATALVERAKRAVARAPAAFTQHPQVVTGEPVRMPVGDIGQLGWLCAVVGHG